MKRCIARPEDEPQQVTALEIEGGLFCYPCLEAGRVVRLKLVQETRTTQEPKIGTGGGVAVIQQQRLFIGFRCPQAGCPNHDVILEPEKVYLGRAAGFVVMPEQD